MMVKIYASPLGEIILAADGGAITGLWFRGQKYECSGLEPQAETKPEDAAVLELAVKWLDAFFAGREPKLDFMVIPHGTDFQKKVWAELMNIPYGSTVSYGSIAKKLGCRSARAVGAAIGKNPVSLVIPCHRVVGANGKLTGYAGGIERKKRLLALENKFT